MSYSLHYYQKTDPKKHPQHKQEGEVCATQGLHQQTSRKDFLGLKNCDSVNFLTAGGIRSLGETSSRIHSP
jgi:hypothetical protein